MGTKNLDRLTNLREQVEFALDTIDSERTVEVPVRSLMFVYKLVEQLNSFFHQPLHYPNIKDVHRFLDGPDGGYRLIA